MEMIAETARLSPSSFGLEPWKFLIVENKELIKEISEVSWGFQRQASTTSHIVIALTKAGSEVKYDSDYIRNLWINTKGVSEEFFEGIKDVLKNFQVGKLEAVINNLPKTKQNKQTNKQTNKYKYMIQGTIISEMSV